MTDTPRQGDPKAPAHVDLTRVLPYGDTLDDGQVMLSFSLPVPHGEEAREAGRQVARALGLVDPMVYHSHDLGEGFSYLIVYARGTQPIDFTKISVPRVDSAAMDKHAVEVFAAERIGRPLRVLGACTGTDAHTVGIDAILNMKGFHGHKGLEAYKGFEVRNLGAQVPNERLIATARAWKADAVLVSQVVTQKDVHRANLASLMDLAEAEGVRSRMLFICGGPRLNHEMALELGFDAGFGAGTVAEDVASYIVTEIVRRNLA
jgi:beta-lysine 5,6-aminomutase beta subunit